MGGRQMKRKAKNFEHVGDRIGIPMKWDMQLINNILETADGYWSYEEHFEQIIEECAELIVALQKRKRQLKENGVASRECIDDIRSELADVIIMSAQLTKMLNSEIVGEFIFLKGAKMVKLIKDGKR